MSAVLASTSSIAPAEWALRVQLADEASFAMGEEFLTDQAGLGQLEFDSILRKIESKDASYKN